MLQQQNSDLQSKVDIGNKEVKKYETLVKHFRELNDREQHVTAKVCSYNTIC